MNIFFQLFSLFSAAPPGRRHSIAVGQSTQSHHQHHTRRKSIQVVCLSVRLFVYILQLWVSPRNPIISTTPDGRVVRLSVCLYVCLSACLSFCIFFILKLLDSITASNQIKVSLFIDSYFSGEPGQPDPEYVCWNQKPQELKLDIDSKMFEYFSWIWLYLHQTGYLFICLLSYIQKK